MTLSGEGDEWLKAIIRDPVLPNLRTHFPGAPDIAAISELLDPGSSQPPSEPPLFSEGLFAFPDWADELPCPADKLDYGSLWTMWVGAVPARLRTSR
jgi:hypothetical protein